MEKAVLCFQYVVPTLVRMKERVDWSNPLAKKCVTVERATADTTVASVSDMLFSNVPAWI